MLVVPSTNEEESGPVIVQSGVRPKEQVIAATAKELVMPAALPKCQVPPFLASEIMREALCPRTPGDRILTLALRLAGGLGLLVGWMGMQSPAGVLVAVGALSLLGLSFLRISYAARAAMAMAVAALSFSMVTLWRTSIMGKPDDLVLAFTVVGLSTALWLRAWHRGSRLARYLVAGSLVPALGWAAWSGSGNLLSLDWDLQSWLPPLTWVVFFILCLLSLLAFMDKHTSGACDVWATCLLVWYGVYVIGREALLNAAGLDTLTALGLSEAVFAAPLSIAVAQLLATMLGKQQRGHHGLVRQAA
jgi:hypothetical protein